MPWRTSDFSLVIWDRAYWGTGYGQETAKLMLDYGLWGLLGFYHEVFASKGLLMCYWPLHRLREGALLRQVA